VIYLVTFGERLKEVRNSRNITLEKLAEDLETTKATLSRYENNLREPKVDFLNKVADYFQVSIDYLLGRTDDPNALVINRGPVKYEVDKDNPPDDKTMDEVQELLKIAIQKIRGK
jgi:transcriptional regulator with XRE-family HTH domain